MDPERRKQLEQRRRELQQRLHRQERRDLISFELAALDRQSVPYEVVFETDELWRWLNDHYPTTSTSIDWKRVPQHRCWRADSDVPLTLAAQVQEEQVDEVEVLFSNGRSPALRMGWQEVLEHGKTIVWWSSEAWLLSRSGGWIIEFVAGEGWCWGRVCD